MMEALQISCMSELKHTRSNRFTRTKVWICEVFIHMFFSLKSLFNTHFMTCHQLNKRCTGKCYHVIRLCEAWSLLEVFFWVGAIVAHFSSYVTICHQRIGTLWSCLLWRSRGKTAAQNNTQQKSNIRLMQLFPFIWTLMNMLTFRRHTSCICLHGKAAPPNYSPACEPDRTVA